MGPGTEPRPCMVLGLKPMGKPSKKKKKKKSSQVLDKTKALHGPRTQAYGETNCSNGESPRLKYYKVLRPVKVLGWWWGTPLFGSLKGLFIFAGDMSSNDYFLYRIEHPVLISALFRASIVIHRYALLCQAILLKLWWHLFISKYFGLSCHRFKCYIIVPSSVCKFEKT